MKKIELTANLRLSKKAKQIIQDAINTHEKYKKAYFWHSPSNASGRRAMEDRFEGKDFVLHTANGKIEVEFNFSVSCKNVYYSMSVYLNGEKKNIKLLKKILNK